MSLRKIVDRSNLETKSKRTHNQAGYLVLPDCVIARSGILQYSDVVCEDGEAVADGALIQVMRPVSALKECYRQFANLPLTLEHPDDDAVTPENAKTLTVGCLGSDPRYEEKNGVGYVICDIVVYDEEAQKSIENGEFTELSAGYETAFRKKRGVSPIGQPYEAEQFLLSPNHVALVQRGRCGSECKVCDSKSNKPTTGVQRMAKKKKSQFRYFLSVGDNDEVVELTPEQAEEIMGKDPDLEVEELDEDEVELEDTDVAGVDTDDADLDKDDEGEETCPECGKSPCECEADEDEDEADEGEEDPDAKPVEDEDEDKAGEDEDEADEGKEDEEDLTFEVAFEDGTVGKMDKVAYEHVQRFLEVSKKGDRRGDSLSKVLALTSRASKILGSNFDIETYTRGDSVDTEAIKRDVIRKTMPGVVVRGLRGTALDSLYRSACRTFSKKQDSFKQDLASLCSVEPSIVDKADKAPTDMVSSAKANFLKRIHNKK